MTLPTPSQRLEERRQLAACRVCVWLVTLEDTEARGWKTAIGNVRYSPKMVSEEIQRDQTAAEYPGEMIGESCG